MDRTRRHRTPCACASVGRALQTQGRQSSALQRTTQTILLFKTAAKSTSSRGVLDQFQQQHRPCSPVYRRCTQIFTRSYMCTPRHTIQQCACACRLHTHQQKQVTLARCMCAKRRHGGQAEKEASYQRHLVGCLRWLVLGLFPFSFCNRSIGSFPCIHW